MIEQGGTGARCMRRVFEIVAGAMPAMLVALIASFMLSFPNQMLDIYRDIAQSIALGSMDTAGGIGAYLGVWRELIQSAVAIVVLSVCLWLAALVLVESRVAHDVDLCWPAVAVRRITPIVIALAPLVMLTAGLLSARVSASTATEIGRALKETFYLFSLERGVSKEVAEIYANNFASRLVGSNAMLTYYAAGAALLAVVLLLVFILLQRRAGLLAVVRARLNLSLIPSILYALVVVGTVVALSLLVADQPVRVADLLKPIATFSVFCVLLLLAMDVIRRFSDMTGLPLLAGVVVLAVGFSLADINDNHAVRYEEVATAPSARPLPRATDEFTTWLSKREDRAEFGGARSYPVYIVAAQGGGIYAAYHASSFLADMQRLCPNFAHHLFAISGVSGGSVGAGVFNAIMREAEEQKQVRIPQTGCNTSSENDGPLYTEAVHTVLAKDLWSPLQAALLFPDFLQRFLFWPVAKFDRALALERGLEQAWLGMINEQNYFNPELKPVSRNLLAEAYARHWDTATYKNVPALVFNTTEVGTGHRRLIAPFQFRGTGTVNFFPLQMTSQVGTSGLLPVSTAAVLSARFPWVTPLGWISSSQPGKKDTGKMRLVDGAYFENSGVATALDLIKELTRAGSLSTNLEINLIILTSAEFSPERWLGTGETLGPIQTMLNTRTARGLIEIERAKQDLRTMNTDRTRFRTVEVKLRGYGYPLPLGWRLSTATRYLIDWQWGVRSRCTQPMEEGAAEGDINCVKELLFRQLSHPKAP